MIESKVSSIFNVLFYCFRLQYIDSHIVIIVSSTVQKMGKRFVHRLVISCIVLANVDIAASNSALDVGYLIKYIFQDYNKNVIPLMNFENKIQLNMRLVITGIHDVNERDQKLVTNGFLHMHWYDDYLKWDPANHNGVPVILIPQKDVWKPDIALKNGFNKMSELGNNFIQVQINYSGSITWTPTEVFETKCSINIRYFPFDEQSCDLVFALWMTGNDMIEFNLNYDAVEFVEVEHNSMWSVVSSSSSASNYEYDSANVTFTINLKRNPSYYIYNLIVPVILLSILTVFTFILPADSGEKMGYSTTVFLSFAVFLTIVSSELPKASGSLLSSYMVFELAVSTCVVCITAFELRLHHRKTEVPKTVQKLVMIKCVRIKPPKVSSTDSDVGKNEIADVTWDYVISRVDAVLFCVILVLKLSVIGGFMIALD